MKSTLKRSVALTWALLNVCLLWAVYPYQDTALPVGERVDDLLSRMTLTEKIAQLGHKSPAISSLGVASYNYWNEALHGVARSGLATSFPQAIALSATWNPELIYNVATAISDEARVYNNTKNKGLVYWSPTINMARDPRWGRSEENYGEDPYLAAQIAVSFIKGMQGNDPTHLKTVATAKHFACNNVEKNRTGISSEVDERSLREYYLPAFETCVKEGNVYSIMSAYNALNGVPSPANRTLLTNILRQEWGFDGFVVSDCDAIENVWSPHAYVGSAMDATAISMLNGNDLNCGDTSPSYAQSALDAGLITEEAITDALKRVFKARFLLGEFDPAASVAYKTIASSVLDCEANRQLAMQTAQEAIVLLKNNNSILPLNIDDIDTIAIIGPNANAVQLGGYSGTPLVSISPVQGIADKLGVDISSGQIEAENYSSQNGIKTESCNEGGSNVGYIQNGDYLVFDNVDFSTGKTKLDVRVASENSGGTLDVVLDDLNGSPIASYTVNTTGGWQSWNTLSLDVASVSGTHTVYLKFSGASGYLYNLNWFKIYNDGDEDPLGGKRRVCYAKGCDIEGRAIQSEIDEAVALAKKATVAVVVVGTDLNVADEGEDRTSLDLPGAQNQLIQAVYAANPNTIVVMVNGSSLSVNWAQANVPAILTAWYDGQAQGAAIADVLFGDYNPAGRLSTTWYQSTSDLPAMSDYDVKNNRTYMYFEGTPLYAFGYGLSYTSFTYSNLTVSKSTLNGGDELTVTADITNSGALAGDEVAQFYVHAHSIIKRPIKELKGFKRIMLQAGETKTVSFTLKHEDLKYYDVSTKTFKVESGEVDIYVGSASDDIRLQSQITTSGATVAETYRQNPFAAIEAETLEGKSSAVSFKSVSNGNLCAHLSGNNSFILLNHLDFSQEAKQINVHLASLSENCTLDVVLDNLNGTVIGSLVVKPTADLNSYVTESCELSGITGVHDVYLVLKGSASDVCRVDWISFQESVTGIDDIISPESQLGFKCMVFPNPASHNFIIKYHLPKKSSAVIDIISAQGTEVVKYNHESIVGWNEIELNCATQNLHPGMYIVRLSTDNHIQSTLMSVVE